VVHISIKAPPLIEKYCTDTLDNFLEAFSSYLHYVEHLPDQNTNYLQIPVDKINEKVNNFYNNWNVSDIDGRVYERIPSQYILKYEAV
jgi:hypothetical protein